MSYLTTRRVAEITNQSEVAVWRHSKANVGGVWKPLIGGSGQGETPVVTHIIAEEDLPHYLESRPKVGRPAGKGASSPVAEGEEGADKEGEEVAAGSILGLIADLARD